MQLLSGWTERIEQAPKSPKIESPLRVLPLAARHFANKITYIERPEGAQKMFELAAQRRLSHIGFDTEFKYDRRGVELKKNVTVFDVRSTHPLLMSLALVEPRTDGDDISSFVIDLRKRELLPFLDRLIRLPVRFVGHFVKVEHFCIWQLGLAEPSHIWDTWAAEKVRYLGRGHYRYKLPQQTDEVDEINAKEQSEEKAEYFHSLVATCDRHGVAHKMSADKKRLQESFLTHPDGASFTEEQIAYAAEDAIAAALLYPKQISAAANDGTLYHLETIEMPWVRTNARVEWNGVKVDGEKSRAVSSACSAHLAELEKQLNVFGISNFRSHKVLSGFFERAELLSLFAFDGKNTFDRKQLESNLQCHEVMPVLYAARLIHDMQKCGIFDSRLIGADGRMHPVHQQLGTHTGRQTTKAPNVLGIAKILRPLIVPETGHGIGEVDLSQIEVGIAAAVYNDVALVDMFNSGDVYASMARKFYSSELSDSERKMTSKEFKQARGDLRDRMKICTLGIIYGMTPFGVSRLLHISEREARPLMDQFMAMFPALEQGLSAMAAFGSIAGHVATVTGLRRYRARGGQLSNWERNWMTNHPVQGSAADTFKEAGNRLDRLYPALGARLIIPFHDAIVFEAPLETLAEAAELTKQELCRAVQMKFPELKPDAEINLGRSDCWNKGGMADTWKEWIADPVKSILSKLPETGNAVAACQVTLVT